MSGFTPRTGYRHRRAIAAILYLLSGPLVWAAHLTIVYGGHTLACARGGGPELAAWIIYAATALGVATLIGAIVYALRQHQAESDPVLRFQHDVMGLMAFLSMAGVIWGGATVALIAPCLMLR